MENAIRGEEGLKEERRKTSVVLAQTEVDRAADRERREKRAAMVVEARKKAREAKERMLDERREGARRVREAAKSRMEGQKERAERDLSTIRAAHVRNPFREDASPARVASEGGTPSALLRACAESNEFDTAGHRVKPLVDPTNRRGRGVSQAWAESHADHEGAKDRKGVGAEPRPRRVHMSTEQKESIRIRQETALQSWLAGRKQVWVT